MPSLCEDDFSPYENSLKHMHKDDQLIFFSILMLNAPLKKPFIADHGEKTRT